jgi:hypothetical protein
MRPTIALQVRIVPRTAVPSSRILRTPKPSTHPAPPTIIQQLLAQRERRGDDWPPNLRIETFEDKPKDYVGINAKTRKEWKKVVKER